MFFLQILDILDAMELSQYKEAFAQENINGEIFSLIDDDILSTELGVASKVHRIQLLKLYQEK